MPKLTARKSRRRRRKRKGPQSSETTVVDGGADGSVASENGEAEAVSTPEPEVAPAEDAA